MLPQVLLKEISSARGRITAMAKEIDRLREATLPSGGSASQTQLLTRFFALVPSCRYPAIFL